MSLIGESNLLYKAIMEGISEGICVLNNIQGVSFYKLALWNDRMVEITSYSMDEATEPGFGEKIFADESNRIKAYLLYENIKNGAGFQLEEFHILQKDGTRKVVQVSLSLLEVNCSKQGLFLVRDITDIKNMEQKLWEAADLKRIVQENEKVIEEAVYYDKLKTEFFANVSHEIRTPLNVIMGAMQLLNFKLKGMLKRDKFNDVERYTSIMKQNCYRVLRLVNNLIDVTKIDSGYMDIELTNVDIVSIVRSITMSVAQYIEDKGIKFSFESQLDEKVIACDPDKIERIILNLISNSAKFTKPGGEIKVEISQGVQTIKIAVIDTGIGIAEEKLNLIFDRFTQAGKSIDREQAGSGIGLSLVKSLVEMHGGSIFVMSQYGRGSRFIIELPENKIPQKEYGEEINNFSYDGRIERIRVEFSDIYM